MKEADNVQYLSTSKQIFFFITGWYRAWIVKECQRKPKWKQKKFQHLCWKLRDTPKSIRLTYEKFVSAKLQNSPKKAKTSGVSTAAFITPK